MKFTDYFYDSNYWSLDQLIECPEVVQKEIVVKVWVASNETQI